MPMAQRNHKVHFIAPSIICWTSDKWPLSEKMQEIIFITMNIHEKRADTKFNRYLTDFFFTIVKRYKIFLKNIETQTIGSSHFSRVFLDNAMKDKDFFMRVMF